MDETLRQWGENIRLHREVIGLTQAQLAEQLDPPVSQATVARWEAGLMEPRRRYKAQLAPLLHTDTRILFPLIGQVA